METIIHRMEENKVQLQSTVDYTPYSIKPEWEKNLKRIDTNFCGVKSLGCTPEINATLIISYTRILKLIIEM